MAQSMAPMARHDGRALASAVAQEAPSRPLAMGGRPTGDSAGLDTALQPTATAPRGQSFDSCFSARQVVAKRQLCQAGLGSESTSRGPSCELLAMATPLPQHQQRSGVHAEAASGPCGKAAEAKTHLRHAQGSEHHATASAVTVATCDVAGDTSSSECSPGRCILRPLYMACGWRTPMQARATPPAKTPLRRA